MYTSLDTSCGLEDKSFAIFYPEKSKLFQHIFNFYFCHCFKRSWKNNHVISSDTSLITQTNFLFHFLITNWYNIVSLLFPQLHYEKNSKYVISRNNRRACWRSQLDVLFQYPNSIAYIGYSDWNYIDIEAIWRNRLVPHWDDVLSRLSLHFILLPSDTNGIQFRIPLWMRSDLNDNHIYASKL